MDRLAVDIQRGYWSIAKLFIETEHERLRLEALAHGVDSDEWKKYLKDAPSITNKIKLIDETLARR